MLIAGTVLGTLSIFKEVTIITHMLIKFMIQKETKSLVKVNQ